MPLDKHGDQRSLLSNRQPLDPRIGKITGNQCKLNKMTILNQTEGMVVQICQLQAGLRNYTASAMQSYFELRKCTSLHSLHGKHSEDLFVSEAVHLGDRHQGGKVSMPQVQKHWCCRCGVARPVGPPTLSCFLLLPDLRSK